MAMTDPTAALVRVSRNGGDDRVRCAVPLAALRNPHWRAERGGDYRPLARRTLAVFVDAGHVPAFGRGGEHGDGGSLVALVEPEDNDPVVYEALRELAAAFKPSRRYLRKRAAGGVA